MAVFAFLCVVAFGPVLWINIPAAMVDYPNHLARMFVIARDGTAHASPFYQVNWTVIPNLAMDLLVPPLGRVIGVEMATRLFYLLSQILIVAGAMAIERVVKGRVHIAGFVALTFLYSLPFAWGFVNFEFGLGCALFGIACALAVLERSWLVRLAAHTVIIGWLFVAHFFALGVYGFTIGLHELWRGWSRRGPVTEIFGRLATLALPTLALLGVMLASESSVGGSETRWFFAVKPLWCFQIMSGYSLTASAASVTAVLTLVFVLGRRRSLRFEQSGVWLAVGYALLYMAMPSKLFDTSFVDLRVIVAAALILPAFISARFPSLIWARGTLALVAAIVILNVAIVLGVWVSYRADYTAAKESFRHLPKSAMVLIGHNGAAADPPLSNLSEYPIYSVPTLAVQYADAFVPNLFTEPGKQPITARAPWQRLDIPYGGPAPISLLKNIAERGAPAGIPSFIRTWPRDFDYLYLVGPPIANPMPGRLVEVSRAPRFVLYRIRK